MWPLRFQLAQPTKCACMMEQLGLAQVSFKSSLAPSQQLSACSKTEAFDTVSINLAFPLQDSLAAMSHLPRMRPHSSITSCCHAKDSFLKASL